jgi:hypothetical protein
MSRSMRVTVDSDAVKPSEAIRTAAGLAPLFVLTGRALVDLERELGSWDAAGRFLLDLATELGRPLGINWPTPTGSRSMFLAPRSWSQDKLRGWVAGHRDELERAFGAATPLDMEDR